MSNKKTTGFPKKILFLLIILYAVSVVIRFWFIKDGIFAFGFDQARDAIYAREILDGNLKLFGPTASGTGDAVFHGVAYYYLLAFLHLFSENPIHVVTMISLITSLSIFPTYLIAKHFTKNDNLSVLASIFTTFSYEQILAGTWLSNPALIILFLPLFIYFWLKVMSDFNTKNMVLSMLFLGLCTQFLLFKIYWIIVPILFFFYDLSVNEWKLSLSKIKIWLLGIGTFLFVIGSMILAELIMIKRGILTLDSLKNFNDGAVGSPSDLLVNVSRLWIDKVADSFSPRLGLLVLLVLFGFIYITKIKSKISHIWFFIVTPFLFLLVYFRNNKHMLIGYEILLYVIATVVTAYLFQNIHSKKVKTIFLAITISIFAILNISGLSQIKINHNHPNSVQKGFLYQDQVDLINKTYELANGEEFSISTLTNPYKINTTWGYLFNYYGRKNFTNIPTFYGSDQRGWVGENMLEIVSSPKPVHFVIIEPDIGLDKKWIDEFMNDQISRSGLTSTEYMFGELKLLEFKKN